MNHGVKNQKEPGAKALLIVLLVMGGMLALIVKGCVALSSYDTDTVQTYSIVGNDTVGCVDRDYLDHLMSYIEDRDNRAFNTGLDAAIGTGECVFFRDGETVFVGDTAFLAGDVRIRRKGSTQAYWVGVGAVNPN